MAKLRIEWAPNPPADQITSYLVRGKINGGNLGVFEVPGSQTFYELDNPQPAAYAFAVAAKNIAGTSAYSADVPGPSAPTVPTGVVVTSVP